MKKVISILLAMTIFTISTSAFAFNMADDNTVAESIYGTTKLGLAYNAANMPVFKTGDTVEISFGNLTEGEYTIVTFKAGNAGAEGDFETSYDNDNIQYIDQGTVPASGIVTIDYTVRSTYAGVYYFIIYNAGNSYVGYYRMGDVDIKMITAAGVPADAATPYMIQQRGENKWSIGFVGKATLRKGDSFEDAGVQLGFRLTGGNFTNYLYPDSISGERIDEFFYNLASEMGKDIEVNNYSVIYGMTVYNVPSEELAGSITATAEAYVH